MLCVVLDFFCIQGSYGEAKVAEQKASSWVKLTEKKKVGIEANEWHFVAVVKERSWILKLSPGSCQAV